MYELHAHFFKHETDCDGPHEDGYVLRLNEDEQARNAEESNVSDMGDYAFKGRVLHNTVALYADGDLRVRQNSDNLPTLTWSEVTDEGHRNVEVRFCRDDCPDERHHRDVYAEQMGY